MNNKIDSSLPTKWRRNLYFFLAGQFLSGITSMIVQYSIIWYLTKITGSATVLSFATLLGMIPMVVLSPFVGPVVDRRNKKFLLIITDIVVALFALILSITGTISIMARFCIVVCSGGRSNVSNADHSVNSAYDGAGRGTD